MVILKFVTDEAVEVSFPLRTFIVYRPGWVGRCGFELLPI